MRHWRERRLQILLGGVLAAVLLYVAFWFTVAHVAMGRLQAAIDQQRKAGWSIVYADLSRGGFPFQIELEFTNLSISGRQGFMPWLLWARKVQIIALPWDPSHIILFGVQPRLQKQIGVMHYPNGRERPIFFVSQAQSLRASHIAPGGKWQATDIVLENVTMGGARRPDTVRIGNLELHGLRLDDAPDHLTAAPLAEYSLSAEQVRPSPALGPFMSQTAPDLELVGKLRGDALPGTPDKLALLGWRDRGGVFDIDSLKFRWGNVDVDVEGAMSLDSRSRPLVGLRARIGNYAALVDGLAADGALAADTAQKLKGVLDQMVQISGDDDRRLHTNLTVSDGQMYVGPVLLMEFVPPLFNEDAPAAMATAQP